MREAAADLEFEEAARLRDEIKRLQDHDLGLDKPGMPGVGGAVGFADRIAQAGAASQAREGKYARSRATLRSDMATRTARAQASTHSSDPDPAPAPQAPTTDTNHPPPTVP